MLQMQDSVVVKLNEPVEYNDEDGGIKITDQVEIRCPTFRSVSDRRYYDHLKSMMAKIVLDEARNLTANKNDQVEYDNDDGGDEDGDEDSKIKPNQMTYILLSNLGDKFTDEVLAFEKYSHLYCFLDGERPLKDGPLNRMHPDDKAFLFGAFMANFIHPSISRLMSGND